MAKKTRSGVYRCKGGFAAPIGGQVVVVPDGALVPYQFGYEVMDGREDLFEDIAAPRGAEQADVEQATAAPGERRTRRSRRSQAPVDEGQADDEPAEDPAEG